MLIPGTSETISITGTCICPECKLIDAIVDGVPEFNLCAYITQEGALVQRFEETENGTAFFKIQQQVIDLIPLCPDEIICELLTNHKPGPECYLQRGVV